MVAGGPRGFAIRAAGLPDRGGPERLADAETPQPGSVQTPFDNHGPLPRGPPALGGQLRPPIRFRVRIPPLLRPVTLYFFREVRQTQKGVPDMGLPGGGMDSVHLSSVALLHNTRLRL